MMLEEIKDRLKRCETWKQPHDDIEWLVKRVDSQAAHIAELEERVVYQTVRPDLTDRIAELEAMLRRAEIVMAAVGLGADIGQLSVVAQRRARLIFEETQDLLGEAER